MENEKFMYFYHFSGRKIAICEENEKIIAIGTIPKDFEFIQKETPLIKKAAMQLEQYFKGERKTFDLPLKFKGTDFQKAVWKELSKITYGKTLTYKEVAEKIKHPKAFRAVGNACNKNQILIVIPCHRVIGSNGNLTGFAQGLPFKEKLLKSEEKFKD